jgi:flagellum-specific ATP synthase
MSSPVINSAGGSASSSVSTDLARAIRTAKLLGAAGEVTHFYGLILEANGPQVFLGERCEVLSQEGGPSFSAQVVGIREGKVLLMSFGELSGVRKGSEVRGTGEVVRVPVGQSLLGRVVDSFGMPLDDKPAIEAEDHYPLLADPLNPLQRAPIREPLETGVKAIDTLLTLGRGQRAGVFAGSGVGKSTLLGMMARNTAADVNVIALVGERGREVPDFIQTSLGEAGLKKSVVVVATSDQPALRRSHAAFAATAIAEYFRDRGQNVLLMMDSITRFAMALREIGLSTGEVPTARGYTPSVFSTLPRLLERAGKLRDRGSITGLYTVLVEGDDMNDPVADHVRAIVDGHIVLSRKLAHEAHYPAIDILQSNSRLANELRSKEHTKLAQRAVRALSLYRDSKDMLDLGVYQRGSNPELDRAIEQMPKLRELLCQPETEVVTSARAFSQLSTLLGAPVAGR